MVQGGIIFLVILGVWAFYLVPVVARELDERAKARAAEQSSDSARVLHRTPVDRDARRVVLTAGRPVVRDDLPARAAGPVEGVLRRAALQDRSATRLRAAGAVLGMVVLLVTGALAATSTLPWWSVTVPFAWVGAVLTAGAVAAAARRRRVQPPRGVVRMARSVPAVRRPSVLFDAQPAGLLSAPVATPLEAAAPQRAVAARPAVVSGAEWTPVQVPLPTYTTKTVAPRPPALPWSLPPLRPTSAEAAVAQAGAAPAAVEGAPTERDEAAEERRSAAS